MRKKFTSKTYLRGVSDWDFVMQKQKSEKLLSKYKKNK